MKEIIIFDVFLDDGCARVRLKLDMLSKYVKYSS